MWALKLEELKLSKSESVISLIGRESQASLWDPLREYR